MNLKYLIGATFELIVKVTALVFIVTFIYKTAVAAYDYGYRVFDEDALSDGAGRTISVFLE